MMRHGLPCLSDLADWKLRQGARWPGTASPVEPTPVVSVEQYQQVVESRDQAVTLVHQLRAAHRRMRRRVVAAWCVIGCVGVGLAVFGLRIVWK
jgi:hypothetical protein